MNKLISKASWVGFIMVIKVLLIALNGCATPHTDTSIAGADDPGKVKAFEAKLNEVVKEVDKDPNYRRIPLDTKEDQEWFLSKAFPYWDNQISKEEFINEGLKRFPEYRDSFKFLAEKFKN